MPGVEARLLPWTTSFLGHHAVGFRLEPDTHAKVSASLRRREFELKIPFSTPFSPTLTCPNHGPFRARSTGV